MSSLEEYEELENLIIQKMENQEFQSPKLDLLQSDPNSYIQHQYLLEKSNNRYVLVYCAIWMYELVSQENPIWNTQLYNEIFEWIPVLFQSKIDIFFQLNQQYRNVIMVRLVKLFIYLFVQLWESNSKLSNFFEMISGAMPDGDSLHRELRYLFFAQVINEIANNKLTPKIKTQIIADKTDTSLFDLFMEVVDSNFSEEYDISQPEHVRMIKAILSLLLAILRFYNKKKKDSKGVEIDDFLCDLSVSFLDILKNDVFLNTLFSFFDQNNNEINFQILDIIYNIVSVKPSYFPKGEDKISLVVPIINNFTQLMEAGAGNDQSIFEKMSFIIYRMSMEKEGFFGEKIISEIEEPFFSFISALREALGAYLTDPATFIGGIVAVVNSIGFWYSIIRNNLSNDQISEMAAPLFQNYIQILIKASSDFPGDIVDILDLDKYTICEAIQIIPRILKQDFATLGAPLESHSQTIFDTYKSILNEKRSSPEDIEQFKICDIQISVFILIMTAGLRSVASNSSFVKKNQPGDFEISFFKFIMEVIEFTDQNIQEIFQLDGMLVEQSLYVFARSFQRTVFAQFSETDNEGNEEVLDYFNKIIKRLIDALSELHVCDNKHFYIFNNLLSIENLYEYLDKKPKSKSKPDGNGPENLPCYPLLLEVTSEFIEAVANGEFHFVNDDEVCLNFKKEISLLMKIIRTIVAKDQETIKPFLDSIEEKFRTFAGGDQNAAATLVFIYELIGIFSNDVGKSNKNKDSNSSDIMASNSQNESFTEFFDWVFPEKLEMFVKIADQVASEPDVATSYFKFWYVFMSQVTIFSGKISNQKVSAIFPKHSANSIILFTMVSTVVVNYLQAFNLADLQDDIYKEKLKPLKNVMLLMSESLGAEYIMFGAFELYEDPALRNLLSTFIDTISNYDLDLILSYPKVSIAFMKLVKSLCKIENHLNSILDISPEFFDYLFKVVDVGLNQIDDDLVDVAVDAGKNMGKFLQTNKAASSAVAESIERNQEVITHIVTVGFDLFLAPPKDESKEKKTKFFILELIYSFLTFLPDYLSSLAEEMTPQVPQADIQEYNEIFQELINTVSDIYVFEKFRPMMQSLLDLSNRIHLKVPVP